MKKRARLTPSQLVKKLWEEINPGNMNDSIRQAEGLLGDLDSSSPEWDETYEYLEAMARYREDVRGD